MGKKSPRPTSKTTGQTSLDKGRLVEHIAARMHQATGFKVETHVFVTPPGTTDRPREIDVLLTSEVAEIPVRVAIECKNEKKLIGIEYIDAFVGKLAHIGIPPQNGMYISSSRYTRDAIDRAAKAGIKLLILRGLTNDRLASEVVEAFQSTVYLLPQISGVTIEHTTEHSPDANFAEVFTFYDQAGHSSAAPVPHITWERWLAGELPSTLGEHELQFPVPDGWFQYCKGQKITPQSVKVTVLVTGLVVTVKGHATQHALINAADNALDKSQLFAEFDKAAQPTVTTIFSEADLEAFFQRPVALDVQIGRIRVPRLVFIDSYWPPSVRVAKLVMERMQAFERGEIPDPRPFPFEEVEGSDISAIWEPIWDGNLATLKTATST